MKRKKETQEKINKSERESGCNIIYDKNKKIRFKCFCGKEDTKSIYNFINMPRCKWCSFEHLSKSQKIKTYDDILNIAKTKGLKIITTKEDYDKKGSLITYQCWCEHNTIVHTSTKNFMKIRGCNKCKGRRINPKHKFNFRYVKEYIESKNGYLLISDSYVSCDSNLDIMCDKGHIFKMDFYHFKNRKQRCSECFAQKDKSGENSATWQGGITPINLRERSTKANRKWIKKVLEKYQYTCICCGSTENLQAHHLYSFSVYKVTRSVLQNGVTLCKNCHSCKIKNSFHNLYGTKNTVPEELYEYIQRYQSGEFNN